MQAEQILAALIFAAVVRFFWFAYQQAELSVIGLAIMVGLVAPGLTVLAMAGLCKA